MNSPNDFAELSKVKLEAETPAFLSSDSDPNHTPREHASFNSPPSTLKRNASQANSEKFICQICEFESLIFDDTYTHFRAAHPDSLLRIRTVTRKKKGTLVNSERGKLLVKAKEHGDKKLEASQKTGHRDRDRAHQCLLCSKFYSSSSCLSTHLVNVHFKTKAFKCDICGYCTSAAAGLKRHVSRHFTETPFQCEHCDTRFKDQGDAVEHNAAFHSSKDTEPNFICDECGALFSLKRSLSEHKLEHQEYLECSLCLEKFTSVVSLKIHMTICMVDNPFKCDQCNKSYSKNDILMRHIERCHPEPHSILGF